MSVRPFRAIQTPEPFVLSDADRGKARTISVRGRPLLLVEQAELVHLCLEMSDQLTQMTAHLRAHMAVCREGRLVIPMAES